MSVAIHHGLRFLRNDLHEILAQVVAYRPVIGALAVEADRSWVARECVERIDDAVVAGKETPRSVVHEVWREMRDRQAKALMPLASRDPGLDTEFKILAFPWEGQVYGMLYTERSAWRDDFLGRGIAERHAYWTGSDREDGVSRREWDARGQRWAAILAQDGHGIPSACGLSFDFPPPMHVVHAGHVIERVPSLDERLSRVARNRMLVARMRAVAGEEPEDPFSFAPVIRAHDWLRTEEGLAAVAGEIEALRPTLPEITHALLTA